MLLSYGFRFARFCSDLLCARFYFYSVPFCCVLLVFLFFWSKFRLWTWFGFVQRGSGFGFASCFCPRGQRWFSWFLRTERLLSNLFFVSVVIVSTKLTVTSFLSVSFSLSRMIIIGAVPGL